MSKTEGVPLSSQPVPHCASGFARRLRVSGGFLTSLCVGPATFKILPGERQLPTWSCRRCQVWGDPTRPFEDGGCWYSLAGLLYICPHPGRECWGQPELSGQKASFTEVSRQVTQNPKCFFCDTFKVSFCCKQLGVFRRNIQWDTDFVHNFPITNISRFPLWW